MHTIKKILTTIFIRPFSWYFGLSLKKKIGVGLLTFFLMGLVIAIFPLLLFFSVSSGMLGKMPTDQELLSVKNYQASEVYSADSVLLGRYFVENRSDASYEEVSPFVFESIIATEDARFYKHTGVDTKSLLRVLFKSVLLGQNTGGGSTITQQLAKNVFGRKSYGWLTMPVVKIREAIIANQLEHLYTKKEILILYINTVSFGEDTYGIKTASMRFFSKTPDKLLLEEAAVLAGTLKSPTYYNPRKNPVHALERRNLVLGQLLKYTYISQKEFDEATQKPLVLEYLKLDNSDGIAPFFRGFVKKEVDKILLNLKKEDGTAYNIFTDGLKVYTTIHSTIQRFAEDAATAHLKRIQPQLNADLKQRAFFIKNKKIVIQELKKTQRYKSLLKEGLSEKEIILQLNKKDTIDMPTLNGNQELVISPMDSVQRALSSLQVGMLVVNPHTGSILAWVGGSNFKQVQFDHVLSKRQAGSVFKPIVYAQALRSGVEPCDFIANQKVTYTQYDDWTPSNSSERENGRYSMAGALANSVNTISVALCMQAGISNVIKFARSLGIESDLPAKPSIALGTAELNLWELTGAYTAFANDGKKSNLQFLTTIVDDRGNELYSNKPVFAQVLTAEEAHTLTNMLLNVVNKGTAHELRDVYGLKGAIAGKTGTTQNHVDGWFMGYTAGMLAGVWVGADNPAIHFSGMNQGRGSATAMPIWAGLYKKISTDKDVSYLVRKEFSFENTVDCEMYKDDTFFQKLFQSKNKKNNNSGLDDTKTKNKKIKRNKKRK
ncbi:transglycosylase domain-containing protein [uncultured Cytophaga sp.]|mgnify:CR=1 FL=1|uniref:transglycosylase domain-containing protein n=1 Tax=uncultured Cytophaga sp. TaxID=160238 RepID=UPI00260D63F4|nr:transglycosylase domain-containing protein [uncultured Cytophaga sp.]